MNASYEYARIMTALLFILFVAVFAAAEDDKDVRAVAPERIVEAVEKEEDEEMPTGVCNSGGGWNGSEEIGTIFTAALLEVGSFIERLCPAQGHATMLLCTRKPSIGSRLTWYDIEIYVYGTMQC